MQGEIVQQFKANPFQLKPVRSDCQYHLYCSLHNPGAEAVARELQGLFSTLTYTSDVNKLESCEHMVLYMNNQTWTRGAESAAFVHEILDAMRLGVHRLLVHEVPGVRMNDNRRACSFPENIAFTEQHFPFLSTPGPLRLWAEIAMNLAEGEWRACGLIKMGQQLAKGSGTCEQWRVETEDLDKAIAWLGPRAQPAPALKRRLLSSSQPFRHRIGSILRGAQHYAVGTCSVHHVDNSSGELLSSEAVEMSHKDGARLMGDSLGCGNAGLRQAQV